MNFRDKLEQSRQRSGSNGEAVTTAEIEEGYACEYFATDNIKSLPACLDLRLEDGNRKALPYSYFTEIDFDISEGIEITTTTKKVKIIGRELERLYDYLVAYRVRFIQTNMGTDLTEDGLFVKEILIDDIS